MKTKKEKGITLIALTVTIIVLIILASITIAALTGDNSVIDQTEAAKEGAEISEEMKLIDISVIDAMEKDKFGELKHDGLESELDKNIKDEAKREYTLEPDMDSEYYRVTYMDTNRKYIVDGDGKVSKADGTEDIFQKKITIAWEDDNDRDGKRPSSVNVDLLKDGVIIKENVELSKNNEWQIAIKDIIQNYDENGNYTIALESQIGSYTSSINNLTITSTHTPEVLPDTVIRTIWNDSDDNDGKRPEFVEITLYADKDNGQTVSITAENNWQYVFSNLYKYRDGGIEISYSIDQKVTPDGYTKEINGFTITNSHELEKVDIAVTFDNWDDDNNSNDTRPTELNLRLKAIVSEELQYGDIANENERIFYEIAETGVIQTEQLVLEQNNYSHIFQKLPKYSKGVEIAYAIEVVQLQEQLYNMNFGGFIDGESKYEFKIIPELKDFTYKIEISSELRSYNETFGRIPVIYSIVGEKNGGIVYDKLECINFENVGTQKITFEITAPVGTILTITQLYCGASYEAISNTVQTIELVPSLAENSEISTSFSFSNEYNYGNVSNGGSSTTSVVYTKEKDNGS